MIDGKDIISADIVIIGGGASGMVAALACKKFLEENKKPGRIILLERNNKLGRKLLATGNGTCNISNINATAEKSGKYFYSKTPGFVKKVLEKYDVPYTLEFFEKLGIEVETQEDGKIYPVCRQSSSVLNALEFEISSKQIEVRKSFEVTRIEKESGLENFLLITGIETKTDSIKSSKNIGENKKSSKNVVVIRTEKIILSAGGKASPKLSSDGAGYDFARKSGHTLTDIFPAITQIKTLPDVNKIFQGQRWNVTLSLEKTDSDTGEKIVTRSEYGEILFTEYGLSGPVALQISRHINAIKEKSPAAVVDFSPGYTNKEFALLLKKRIGDLSEKPLERILIGLLPLRIATELTEKAIKNSSKRKIKSITVEELSKLIVFVKNYKFKIIGTTGFEKAQITAGGILCSEVDPDTCESLICKNLYFCGEILDVDGDCGGFNLQFAWSSGFLAGESAGKYL